MCLFFLFFVNKKMDENTASLPPPILFTKFLEKYFHPLHLCKKVLLGVWGGEVFGFGGEGWRRRMILWK